jgi:hypothetical protein
VNERAALLAETLGQGWIGAVHLLAALGDEDWGITPRVLREASVASAHLHELVRAVAREMPPPPSGGPPIVWWVKDTASADRAERAS